MTTTSRTASGPSVGPLAVAATLLGGLVVAYGLSLLSVSLLGGVWVAAVGLSLALAGLFATGWVGRRFALEPATRRRLSLAFAALAVLLLVAFVAVNGAAFEPGTAAGTTG